MDFKLGMRVVVKPNVSPCKDEGSLQNSRRERRGDEGTDRSHLVGKKAEIVQIGQAVLPVKARAGNTGEITIPDPACVTPATVPPGCEGMVLVDSHVSNGMRQGDGMPGWREWFKTDEIEPG